MEYNYDELCLQMYDNNTAFLICVCVHLTRFQRRHFLTSDTNTYLKHLAHRCDMMQL